MMYIENIDDYCRLEPNSRPPVRVPFEDTLDEVMGTHQPMGELLMTLESNLSYAKDDLDLVKSRRRAWLADVNARVQAMHDASHRAAEMGRLNKRISDTQAQLSAAENRARYSCGAKAQVRELSARLLQLKAAKEGL